MEDNCKQTTSSKNILEDIKSVMKEKTETFNLSKRSIQKLIDKIHGETVMKRKTVRAHLNFCILETTWRS